MTTTQTEAEASPSHLAAGKQVEVFFDGDCPLCQREIAMLKRWDRHAHIQFTDITLPDFQPETLGLTHEQLMAAIHGRLPDGTLIHGMEVFRQLYAAIGFRWLAGITRFPVLKQTLDLAYRVFAKNRLRLTGRCTPESCDLTASPSNQRTPLRPGSPR